MQPSGIAPARPYTMLGPPAVRALLGKPLIGAGLACRGRVPSVTLPGPPSWLAVSPYALLDEGQDPNSKNNSHTSHLIPGSVCSPSSRPPCLRMLTAAHSETVSLEGRFCGCRLQSGGVPWVPVHCPFVFLSDFYSVHGHASSSWRLAQSGRGSSVLAAVRKEGPQSLRREGPGSSRPHPAGQGRRMRKTQEHPFPTPNPAFSPRDSDWHASENSMVSGSRGVLCREGSSSSTHSW